MLLACLSVNAYGAEFTYDNSWDIVYEENGNNHNYHFKSEGLEKVPSNDCVLSPVVHKYRAKDDDTFSRVLACFKDDIKETFKCNFDVNWKDEDGEKDEYATTCCKKYGKFMLVHK